MSAAKRLSVKFYAKNPEVVEGFAVVSVFQRWIQEHAIEGMLIDVANYEHVPNGPGILLIAHEGDYSFTESEGKAGLQYISKQPIGDDLETSLLTVFRLALDAAIKLEKEAALKGLSFDFGTVKIAFQDRLKYPNNVETFDAVKPALSALFQGITGEAVEIINANAEDSREAFAVSIALGAKLSGEELLGKLAVAQ